MSHNDIGERDHYIIYHILDVHEQFPLFLKKQHYRERDDMLQEINCTCQGVPFTNKDYD